MEAIKPQIAQEAIKAQVRQYIGANFLMGDGSVRYMNYQANAVLPQLCSRNGGEVVNATNY